VNATATKRLAVADSQSAQCDGHTAIHFKDAEPVRRGTALHDLVTALDGDRAAQCQRAARQVDGTAHHLRGEADRVCTGAAVGQAVRLGERQVPGAVIPIDFPIGAVHHQELVGGRLVLVGANVHGGGRVVVGAVHEAPEGVAALVVAHTKPDQGVAAPVDG